MKRLLLQLFLLLLLQACIALPHSQSGKKAANPLEEMTSFVEDAEKAKAKFGWKPVGKPASAQFGHHDLVSALSAMTKAHSGDSFVLVAALDSSALKTLFEFLEKAQPGAASASIQVVFLNPLFIDQLSLDVAKHPQWSSLGSKIKLSFWSLELPEDGDKPIRKHGKPVVLKIWPLVQKDIEDTTNSDGTKLLELETGVGVPIQTCSLGTFANPHHLQFDPAVGQTPTICANMQGVIGGAHPMVSVPLLRDIVPRSVIRRRRYLATRSTGNGNSCASRNMVRAGSTGCLFGVTSCDEFPYASTNPASYAVAYGAASGWCVPIVENQRQGGALRAFYANCCGGAACFFTVSC